MWGKWFFKVIKMLIFHIDLYIRKVLYMEYKCPINKTNVCLFKYLLKIHIDPCT
jgi:hypothetical protein